MEALDMNNTYHDVRGFSKTLLQLYPREIPSRHSELFVTGLATDSRKVVAGDLFFALDGLQFDGRDYIDTAITNGAVAVFAETDTTFLVEIRAGVPVISIPNLGSELGSIASRFYDNPTSDLSIVGVTGTNGKTTCSHMIAVLSHYIGRQCGVIGTLGYGVGADKVLQPTGFTTPDAIQLQQCMSDLREWGCEAVAIEVSSHALVQHRVDAVLFNIAVLTNLTREHLDFHQDMEGYASAKRSLFYFNGLETAVINADDEFGRRLIQELNQRVAILSYSTKSNQADIVAKNISYSLTGIRADVATPWGSGQLSIPLVGDFNLSNALAALAAMLAAGADFKTLLNGFNSLSAIAGRMEVVTLGSTDSLQLRNITDDHSAGENGIERELDITVVVDYAHTPQALEVVLNSLKPHVKGKVWCVFGCGGDRDHGKRAEMGRIVRWLADSVVVTSDNPRGEPAAQIIDDVLLGIDDMQSVYVEQNREAAIALAIEKAEAGDLILLAGKGHETFQLIGDQKVPFCDTDIAKRYLLARNGE